MAGTNPAVRKSSRRKVSIHDASRWIFNRMAQVYDARPAYPNVLLDTIAELAEPIGRRLGDLGAGIGHLAIPLAERGFEVTAIEPAQAMLERLELEATKRAVVLRSLHAAAESLPLAPGSLDTVLIADALHFIDTELAGREIRRVLTSSGLLLLVSCALGDSPFMTEVARIMHEAAQRKPRQMQLRRAQLAGVARVRLEGQRVFRDATPVTLTELDRILASVSFIGPAMNPERSAAFRQRICALTERFPAVWERKLTLRWGRSSG